MALFCINKLDCQLKIECFFYPYHSEIITNKCKIVYSVKIVNCYITHDLTSPHLSSSHARWQIRPWWTACICLCLWLLPVLAQLFISSLSLSLPLLSCSSLVCLCLCPCPAVHLYFVSVFALVQLFIPSLSLSLPLPSCSSLVCLCLCPCPAVHP